jgi:hypothetical protein
VLLSDVRFHPRNRRRGDVPKIVDSIRLNGWFGTAGRQRSSGLFIWGNHRTMAAQEAAELIARARSGAWEAHDEEEAALIESWASWPERWGELDAVAVMDIDVDDEEAENILLIDNASSDAAEWDRPGLVAVLTDIDKRRGTLAGTGFTRPDLEALVRDARALDGGGFARPEVVRLSDRFLVPPFTVLDARQGYWQARKREWLSLGIRSELGRARNLLKSGETSVFLNPDKYGDRDPSRSAPNRSTPASDSGNDPQFYFKKQQVEARLGREITTAEFLAEHYEGPDAYWEGTSLFDPVLCELAYRWFSPPGARVLDPFAGGSVRGVVASRLGREYHGIDLRPEQCAANEEQLSICRPEDPQPTWYVGDARAAPTIVEGQFDLLFSCPPYFNLEQYGDDPGDLSNASDWEAFCNELGVCIAAGAQLLRPGRFAVLVVGNLRENELLLDLQGATIAAAEKAGLAFYNDAVLVTALGSVPLRAARNFARRKLGRTHQAVLVFVKGSLEDALAACGPIEMEDVAEAVAAVPVVT